MAELVLSVFIDGLMAVLLLITTFYCWRLNKRIKVLQDSKSELGNIIRRFDESTQKATLSIADIHEATSRLAENMQHKIDKANYLADDLQFMIEKGNKLADKMEGGISASRSAPRRESRPASEEEGRPAKSKKTSRANIRYSAAKEEADEVEEKSKGRTSLESVLKRVSPDSDAKAEAKSEKKDTSARDERRAKRQGARLRSKAEQELFEALKTGGGKA